MYLSKHLNMLSIYLMELSSRKVIEPRRFLFILKNVASLCEFSYFVISVTVFFRLYDPCGNFKIDLINSAFLQETGLYSEPSKRAD